MKRLVFIVFTVLSLLAPCRSMAQDEIVEFVADQLKTFQKDFTKMERQFRNDTTIDVEQFEIKFKANNKLVESWYSQNSEIIFSEKDLQTKYIEFTTLQESIQKEIDDRKAAKVNQERFEKLSAKFDKYLQTMKELEDEGNRLVEAKNNDSLQLVKTKARDNFSMATMEYGKSQEFIDDNDSLSMLWMIVKDTNTRIDRLEVAKSGVDLTQILMIVGIIAALVIVITLVSSMVKSAKIGSKPKAPKPKKEEDLPSI